MLRSVVDLISLYNEEAGKSEKGKVIAGVLNQKEREKYLFATLAVPSDLVRLSVVQCLSTVPIDELDAGEVSQLVSLLSNVSNVSVGRTEEVRT